MSLTAVFLLALAAAPQTSTPPAPAPQTAAPTAPAGALTLDTPLEALVANPAAKTVLDTNLQTDITQYPGYDDFKSMSLKQLQPLSGGRLSDELLAKIAESLAAIK